MPNEQVVGQIALKMVLNDTDYKRSLSSAEKRADTASTNMAASFKKVGAAIAKAFTVAAVVGDNPGAAGRLPRRNIRFSAEKSTVLSAVTAARSGS